MLRPVRIRLTAHKSRLIMTSGHPGNYTNLTDVTGEIATGNRADLVLVEWPKGQTPAIQGTSVAGRCAYRGTPHGG